ncbi:MAG TPA: hypothetical protein VG737_08050, partial [Cyclobacteriaceae bacterium]|nr:hypothetical protein [Cyclobacteriaceae bacterium]
MKSNVIVSIVVMVAAAAAALFYFTPDTAIDAKAAAAEFPKKRWYYSLDNGQTWSSRAEGDLKGWKENGDPIHIKPEWNNVRWIDKNTLKWSAINGETSLWKTFDHVWTTDKINEMKGYAAAFSSKKWYYSVDGKNWSEGANHDLKEFDEFGVPVHTSPAWISATWED